MWDSIHYLYGRSRWLILLYSDLYQRDTDHYEKVPNKTGTDQPYVNRTG